MGRAKHIITGILSLMLAAMSSCVYDDQSDCTLDLRFRYVYNMQTADGFCHEADEVTVYIFDSEKHLVSRHSAPVSGESDFTMHLPLPSPGKYTFVAWAKSNNLTDKGSDFEMSEEASCQNPEMLHARLRRTDGKADSRLNSLLNGTLEAEVSGSDRHLTIDMMKCTNAIRVILMPSRADRHLSSEDYDIHIEGRNGWLAYDASTYRNDHVDYYPYQQYLEQDANRSEQTTTEINHAVVADLNTSRILDGSNPRLVVRNSRLNREVLNIDLAWFLSLQSIGEHKDEWSAQEYLDRQDEYAMTFFIDGSTWMTTRIVINGWVLSLEDAELK